MKSEKCYKSSENLWNEHDEWKEDKRMSLNILLVDDNMFNMMILQNYTKKLEENFNMIIFKAFNGEEVNYILVLLLLIRLSNYFAYKINL